MAKLYFRHGTVGSAKTLNLLAVAHNYRQQNKRVLLIKPSLDTRFGEGTIRSRAGLDCEADLLVHADTRLDDGDFRGLQCALVDEAQFVSPAVIDQLRRITLELEVPVICYGLRTDFRGHLFDGARRLFEMADSIEEIKTTCAFCNRKAIMNLKHTNGVATVEGPSVDLGAEEKYFPACWRCYTTQIEAARRQTAEGSAARVMTS
jgi:thymidine kinase